MPSPILPYVLAKYKNKIGSAGKFGKKQNRKRKNGGREVPWSANMFFAFFVPSGIFIPTKVVLNRSQVCLPVPSLIFLGFLAALKKAGILNESPERSTTKWQDRTHPISHRSTLLCSEGFIQRPTQF